MAGLTIDNPVSFAKAIVSNKILPGDVLQLRGGTYVGDWISTISGTEELPVTIQPYDGEEVTIEGTLNINGIYTHWSGLNFHNDDPTESIILMTKLGTKLNVCDISGGFLGVQWFGSGTGEIKNCTFHDTASYGIYTHNNVGGLRKITDCIFSSIGGYYALHMYSESGNAVRDYLVTGCTFDKFVVVHSPIAVTNIEFSGGNVFGAPLHLGNGLTVQDDREFVVNGNTFNGSSGIRAWACSVLSIAQNIMAVGTTNIALVRDVNEVSLEIDQNDYTGGNFSLDGTAKTWAQWQAVGYDANGSYA